MKQKQYPYREIAQVIFKNAQILDITGPTEVFAQVNDFLMKSDITNEPAYKLTLVSQTKGAVVMSSGLKLIADESFKTFRPSELNLLLVPGGDGVYKSMYQEDLLAFVKRQYSTARRVASICTGTFILAEAGLLNGKQATTHWSRCEKLTRMYPEIEVKPDKIYIKDGNLYSSAGVTAGIDLALALVEDDFGRDMALQVAKQLVVFMKRQGGQSQFSTHLVRQSAVEGTLENILKWMNQNPSQDMSVDALADRCAMSERNFSRVFKKEVCMTPGKYVEKMRVEYAANMIETQNLGFKSIAETCGFRSEEMMRRAFIRQLSILPHLYRKNFGM